MRGGLKTINLEEGHPTCDAAIRRLTYELHAARSLEYAALKLIHGYGSTGAGGRIRVEARAYLGRLLQKRQIRAVVTGEQFSIFDEVTRAAFTRCGELRRDPDVERHNNGVTFVIL
ncbi:MAG: hypothetical protein LBK75_06065 [Oscillospiraceae bacterium]|jgi:hypothetical protein|nr:hypothetical protein [Oscillospiraceae bacterium]